MVGTDFSQAQRGNAPSGNGAWPLDQMRKPGAGMPAGPQPAPAMPPTMAATVSVSPPHSIAASTAPQQSRMGQPGMQGDRDGVERVAADAARQAQAGGKGRRALALCAEAAARSIRPASSLPDSPSRVRICAAYSAGLTRPSSRHESQAACAASAACSALGSVWVRRVEARTCRRSSSASSPQNTPISALRIAGPLPAENTPCQAVGANNHSLRIPRRVAGPVPRAGRTARSAGARRDRRETGRLAKRRRRPRRRDQRLRDHDCVLGIVGAHAAAAGSELTRSRAGYMRAARRRDSPS